MEDEGAEEAGADARSGLASGQVLDAGDGFLPESEAAAATSTETEQLKPQWLKFFDEENGVYYYFDPITEEVQYDAPEEYVDVSGATDNVVLPETQSTELDKIRRRSWVHLYDVSGVDWV